MSLHASLRCNEKKAMRRCISRSETFSGTTALKESSEIRTFSGAPRVWTVLNFGELGLVERVGVRDGENRHQITSRASILLRRPTVEPVATRILCSLMAHSNHG